MNPKRRFFQIHLSTAVVLMLVAGVLVWANTIERGPNPIYFRQYVWIGTGWPFQWKHELCYYDDMTEPVAKVSGLVLWTKGEAIGDVVIALAILLSVCVACEWRIRRRAVPPQKSP